MKKIFLIGGMSESGKSTVGRYLDAKGIKRLKIVTFLKKVMERGGTVGDFQQWNDRTEQERPKWLYQQFVEELRSSLQKGGIEHCCLESLYRPEFGHFLKNALPGKVVIVYVEIPLEVRLQRQILRQNLSSIEEAKDYLLPRDKKKEEWGTPRIKKIADVIINNSGTIADLYQQIDSLIKQFCPELSDICSF